MNVNADNLYHSVTVDRDRCMGCTHCLQRCPTQAIRIRDRCARIIDRKCIDCGVCIIVCPYHAMIAATDPLDSIARFPYKIALPDPTLYGQFKGLPSIGLLLSAFPSIGFDWVYEVARAADLVAVAIKERLSRPDCPRPLISSSCPTVVRLIQARFPELLLHIVDLKAPMEVAAEEAKRQFSKERGVPVSDIGCFFITPCSAKMTVIKSPLGHLTSAVDGAISMLDLYGALRKEIERPGRTETERTVNATPFGVRWASSGGEAQAIGIDSALAVDGIDNVIRVLEEIENGKLSDLLFFEGKACNGGCVGGPLAFENGYVAKHRMHGLATQLLKIRPEETVTAQSLQAMDTWISADQPILPVEVTALDSDMGVAMEKMRKIEALTRGLPGLDCGSCGSPTCQTHAEDAVTGYAKEMDCVHLRRGATDNQVKGGCANDRP